MDSRFAEVEMSMILDYVHYQNKTYRQFVFLLDRYDLFFNGFIKYLKMVEKNQKLLEYKSKLMHIKNLAGGKIDSRPEDKAQKEKLQDDKYLFSTRLHYKAELENVSFAKICREAAEKYVDINGNDFTGRQLENTFKSMNSTSILTLKDLRIRAGILKYLQ